ncbi:MAG: hypothetical protein ACE5JL_08020 [Dehalococcoidia bacterium]
MPRGTDTTTPVLVVDEQELFRQGLRTALEGAGITIVGEYGSAPAALQLEGTEGELEPGTVVLVSLTLSGWDELVHRLLLQAPDSAILGVADQVSEEIVIKALSAGILDCMDRTLPPEKWVERIQEVSSGEFSPVGTVIRYPGLARHTLMLLSEPPAPSGLQPLAPLLIDRERLALGNVSEGVPLEIIVERMGVPEQSLHKVLESACRKLVARHRLSGTLDRVR